MYLQYEDIRRVSVEITSGAMQLARSVPAPATRFCRGRN